MPILTYFIPQTQLCMPISDFTRLFFSFTCFFIESIFSLHGVTLIGDIDYSWQGLEIPGFQLRSHSHCSCIGFLCRKPYGCKSRFEMNPYGFDAFGTIYIATNMRTPLDYCTCSILCNNLNNISGKNKIQTTGPRTMFINLQCFQTLDRFVRVYCMQGKCSNVKEVSKETSFPHAHRVSYLLWWWITQAELLQFKMAKISVQKFSYA